MSSEFKIDVLFSFFSYWLVTDTFLGTDCSLNLLNVVFYIYLAFIHFTRTCLSLCFIDRRYLFNREKKTRNIKIFWFKNNWKGIHCCTLFFPGYGDLTISKTHVGCLELLNTVQRRVKPKYHVFGHVREGKNKWQ